MFVKRDFKQRVFHLVMYKSLGHTNKRRIKSIHSPMSKLNLDEALCARNYTKTKSILHLALDIRLHVLSELKGDQSPVAN